VGLYQLSEVESFSRSLGFLNYRRNATYLKKTEISLHCLTVFIIFSIEVAIYMVYILKSPFFMNHFNIMQQHKSMSPLSSVSKRLFQPPKFMHFFSPPDMSSAPNASRSVI